MESSRINLTWKRLAVISPEAIWVFVGQAGTAMAGFLGIKLLTYVLNPAEYGRLALANTIVMLVGMNLFGPLGQGLMRFWSISKDRGDLDNFYAVSNRYARYATYLTLLVISIVFIIFVLIKNIDWAILLALSLSVGAISGLLSLRISVFNAARQRRRVALIQTGSYLLRPMIAAFLIILIASNASWAMLGYLLATFLILLIAERLYRHTVSATSSTLKWDQPLSLFQGVGKEIFSFSGLFFIWGIFSWIKASWDRWSLQTFYGPEVVGVYTVVMLLATYSLTFGSGFLTRFFLPIAFQRAGDLKHYGSIESANKILITMIAIYIIGASILVAFFKIFHRPLVLLISTDRFVKFSFLLPWLTAVLAFYQLGEMLVSFGALANRLQVYLVPKIISSILAGIFIPYFSAKMGLVGVVWGFALAGLVYTPWCAMKTIKLIRNSLYNEEQKK